MSKLFDFLYFPGLVSIQFFCQHQKHLMLHHTQSEHVMVQLFQTFFWAEVLFTEFNMSLQVCHYLLMLHSHLSSPILLGTKNYPILLVQRPLIFINRISIIFLILRMFFVIWLSLSFTSNKFLTFSEKSSSYRIILNAKKLTCHYKFAITYWCCIRTYHHQSYWGQRIIPFF